MNSRPNLTRERDDVHDVDERPHRRALDEATVTTLLRDDRRPTHARTNRVVAVTNPDAIDE